MSDHIRYKCPECGRGGAHPASSPAPKCHGPNCQFKVTMVVDQGKCWDCKWPVGSKVEQLCLCHLPEAQWTKDAHDAYDRALQEARSEQLGAR